jgi:hypothetical protein
MLLIFYIVHEENPQGEFFDVHSGVPVLGSLVPLLAAWWLLPFAAIVLIGGALYLLRHLVRRKSTP